jgi:hypothetical protein
LRESAQQAAKQRSFQQLYGDSILYESYL